MTSIDYVFTAHFENKVSWSGAQVTTLLELCFRGDPKSYFFIFLYNSAGDLLVNLRVCIILVAVILRRGREGCRAGRRGPRTGKCGGLLNYSRNSSIFIGEA